MRSFFQLLMALLILSFAGCATSESVLGPDGEPAQRITCGGIKLCYQKASEVCGKYKVLSTTNDFDGNRKTTTSQIHLLVKCLPN